MITQKQVLDCRDNQRFAFAKCCNNPYCWHCGGSGRQIVKSALITGLNRQEKTRENDLAKPVKTWGKI